MANKLHNANFDDTIHCSFLSIKPTQLEDLCKSLNKTVASLAQDYIWHREEFKICVSVFDGQTNELPVHLTSTTNFGDNIEDEWFIVYLVLKISNQYTDLLIQLEDNDGDFLLIEAAEFLPSWANPDTTKNRVFIYRNKIHIIPPEVVDLDSKLDVEDAIHTVVQKSDKTEACTEIQEAVFKRISSYPEKIIESLHRALVTLPVDIATILALKPSLISPIVNSFCNYDMWDTKYLKNVEFQDCVTVPVFFTKYLYAMLIHSKLPRISKFGSTQNKKDILIGQKLTCGYEIVMSQLSEDVFATTEYHKFINRLTKNGYFKENIKGSKNYNQLLEKARDYFSNMECPISSYYCQNINEIKATEKFKLSRELIKNNTINLDESNVDSDDWLNINPDELNTFLNTHYGKKVVNSQASTAFQITTDLGHFLKKTSDFEGIEYVREENESDTNQIDFDTNLFISSIEKMLSLISDKDNGSEEFNNNSNEEDNETIDSDENLERELAFKLHNSDLNDSKDEYIIKNLIQSIREEGLSGPSSNVLKNVGVSEIELLDSDDD